MAFAGAAESMDNVCLDAAALIQTQFGAEHAVRGECHRKSLMLQLPLVFAFKQILVQYFFVLSVAQPVCLLRSLEVLPRFLFRL